MLKWPADGAAIQNEPMGRNEGVGKWSLATLGLCLFGVPDLPPARRAMMEVGGARSIRKAGGSSPCSACLRVAPVPASPPLLLSLSAPRLFLHRDGLASRRSGTGQEPPALPTGGHATACKKSAQVSPKIRANFQQASVQAGMRPKEKGPPSTPEREAPVSVHVRRKRTGAESGHGLRAACRMAFMRSPLGEPLEVEPRGRDRQTGANSVAGAASGGSTAQAKARTAWPILAGSGGADHGRPPFPL